MNDLPDYYLGSLIYYDPQEGETMNWICYDGRTKYRSISRAAAEKCARDIATRCNEGQITHLTVARHFLTRAWKTLDKAAADSDIETRLWLELKAVEVRKLADAIDILTSKKIPLKSNL